MKTQTRPAWAVVQQPQPHGHRRDRPGVHRGAAVGRVQRLEAADHRRRHASTRPRSARPRASSPTTRSHRRRQGRHGELGRPRGRPRQGHLQGQARVRRQPEHAGDQDQDAARREVPGHRLGRRHQAEAGLGDRATVQDRTDNPACRTTSPYRHLPGVPATDPDRRRHRHQATRQGVRDHRGDFQDTPESVRPVIGGLSRLSNTIASRDAELRTLLAKARDVTGVLADRDQQITTLLSDGNLLLAELTARRDAIHSLLVNTSAARRRSSRAWSPTTRRRSGHRWTNCTACSSCCRTTRTPSTAGWRCSHRSTASSQHAGQRAMVRQLHPEPEPARNPGRRRNRELVMGRLSKRAVQLIALAVVVAVAAGGVYLVFFHNVDEEGHRALHGGRRRVRRLGRSDARRQDRQGRQGHPAGHLSQGADGVRLEVQAARQRHRGDRPAVDRQRPLRPARAGVHRRARSCPITATSRSRAPHRRPSSTTSTRRSTPWPRRSARKEPTSRRRRARTARCRIWSTSLRPTSRAPAPSSGRPSPTCPRRRRPSPTIAATCSAPSRTCRRSRTRSRRATRRCARSTGNSPRSPMILPTSGNRWPPHCTTSPARSPTSRRS